MEGRFGKIVLVVLGVILMIVFILPAGLQNMAGSNARMGTIEGEDVAREDIVAADSLYQYATHRLRVPLGAGQELPLSAAIFGEYSEKLEEDPELFYLLLREAQENGTKMPPEPLERLLADLDLRVLVDDRSSPDGQRLTDYSNIPGEAIREDVRRSVGALLAVNRSFRRYADYPRVSGPVLDYFVSTQAQRVDLRTVVFDAMSFLDRVESPTDAAMQAHFDAFKDKLAGAASEENPFGFGYRLPDGVKFDYITISSDNVRRHLLQELAAMPLQERERALYSYWRENRARFPALPTTQPTTQPTTAPTTQPTAPSTPPANDPTTQPVASADSPATRPTTLPADDQLLTKANPEVAAFLEAQTQQVAGKAPETDWRAFVSVHDDVAVRYLASRVTELRGNVAKRVREILSSDYRAYDLARASSSTATTQAARTRSGVAVDDPGYLESVADLIAGELGVRPSVAIYAREFYDREALDDEAEVGPIANAISTDFQTMFSGYIMGGTLPLLEGQARTQVEQSGNGLVPYKPSLPIVDAAGNDHIFRVIEARPDAAPAALAEAADKVREDLRKRAAYDLAEEQARHFAGQARLSSLEAAAEIAGLTVHDPQPFIPFTGLLDAQSFGEPEGEVALDPAARSDLVESIYGMLADPELAEIERPIGVLQIRPAFRVVVAQLEELVAGWGDDQMLALQREQLHEQIRQQSMSMSNPGAEFFDFNRVAARVGYERSEPRTEDPE